MDHDPQVPPNPQNPDIEGLLKPHLNSCHPTFNPIQQKGKSFVTIQHLSNHTFGLGADSNY